MSHSGANIRGLWEGDHKSEKFKSKGICDPLSSEVVQGASEALGPPPPQPSTESEKKCLCRCVGREP